MIISHIMTSSSAYTPLAAWRDVIRPVQPPRIYQIDGIALDINKQINPPLQPYGIGSYISPGLRIVISEVVVMQSCFLVVVLARKYSDTSPPKKACFLPPLMFSFQRANGPKS
jgi:hypothetical protein